MAAAPLFATHGFDGTSMNGIAQESGLSLGSLYRYFPNEEAIVDAVAADYVRAWNEGSDVKMFAALEPITLRGVVNLAPARTVDFKRRKTGPRRRAQLPPPRAACSVRIARTLDCASFLPAIAFRLNTIAALISALRKLREVGGAIELRAENKSVRRIIRLHGLECVFECPVAAASPADWNSLEAFAARYPLSFVNSGG